MREVLFRGKRIDNGAWETGSLVVIRAGCGDESVFIADKMTGYHILVNPATVGQYTGLMDKNGVKIFEGDVMEFDAYQRHYIGVVTTQDGNTDIRCKDASPFLDDAVKKRSAVVIGNIHDNPELLEETE